MEKSMIKSILTAVIVIVVAGVLSLGFYYRSQRPSVASFEECAAAGFPVMESYPRQCRAGDTTFTETVPQPTATDIIMVSTPLPNALIQSPFLVTGEARGNWYFEASFPIRLLDSNGNVLAATHADATEDWMTTEFVPFRATIEFQTPATAAGTLVLVKDNPSGLPQYDDQISIPVRFKNSSSEGGGGAR
ncbi:MAG: hypothetical protein UY96_C0023G0007 [Parcubacteria group bacterium GW2011_GWB1_56_8]|nr:MAG: hypothetical protein UY96_C0023G0007 [Parcubacteria group bacterium GW2011_GWB1_56_8]